jgi:hypothetical protein
VSNKTISKVLLSVGLILVTDSVAWSYFGIHIFIPDDISWLRGTGLGFLFASVFFDWKIHRNKKRDAIKEREMIEALMLSNIQVLSESKQDASATHLSRLI